MNFIDEQDFYIFSDAHFGDKKISKKRGFKNINEHDDKIIGELMNLPDKSTIICLGDLSCGNDDYALNILRGIKEEKNFTLVLTPCNHDKIHPMYGMRNQLLWSKPYSSVFDLITNSIQLENHGNNILTHYPSYPDKHTNPHTFRWMPNEDKWDCIIHGHIHSKNNKIKKHVNVSLEATDMKIIHSEQLWNLIEKKKRR